jgi:cell wall-associated NlpC family hydrolase
VREIPLEQLVDRNHYVIVVRPTGMTAAQQSLAVARARLQLGTAFDDGGMFGLDDPEKFYCSELVWWASEGRARTTDQPVVITPSDLMKYGDVIYWSGKRDDAQIMELAQAR